MPNLSLEDNVLGQTFEAPIASHAGMGGHKSLSILIGIDKKTGKLNPLLAVKKNNEPVLYTDNTRTAVDKYNML